MKGPKLARFWQVLGCSFVLLGFYTLVFEDAARAVIFLGGGSAMLLILGRTKNAKTSEKAGEQ